MASPRMDLSHPPEDITHESATTQKDLVKHKKTVHKILNLRISHSAGQSLQRLRPFLFCCATHLTSSFCKNVSITVSQLLVQVALTMRAGKGTGGYWCLVCEMEPYGPPPPPPPRQPLPSPLSVQVVHTPCTVHSKVHSKCNVRAPNKSAAKSAQESARAHCNANIVHTRLIVQLHPA